MKDILAADGCEGGALQSHSQQYSRYTGEYSGRAVQNGETQLQLK